MIDDGKIIQLNLFERQQTEIPDATIDTNTKHQQLDELIVDLSEYRQTLDRVFENRWVRQLIVSSLNEVDKEVVENAIVEAAFFCQIADEITLDMSKRQPRRRFSKLSDIFPSARTSVHPTINKPRYEFIRQDGRAIPISNYLYELTQRVSEEQLFFLERFGHHLSERGCIISHNEPLWGVTNEEKATEIPMFLIKEIFYLQNDLKGYETFQFHRGVLLALPPIFQRKMYEEAFNTQFTAQQLFDKYTDPNALFEYSMAHSSRHELRRSRSANAHFGRMVEDLIVHLIQDQDSDHEKLREVLKPVLNAFKRCRRSPAKHHDLLLTREDFEKPDGITEDIYHWITSFITYGVMRNHSADFLGDVILPDSLSDIRDRGLAVEKYLMMLDHSGEFSIMFDELAYGEVETLFQSIWEAVSLHWYDKRSLNTKSYEDLIDDLRIHIIQRLYHTQPGRNAVMRFMYGIVAIARLLEFNPLSQLPGWEATKAIPVHQDLGNGLEIDHYVHPDAILLDDATTYRKTRTSTEFWKMIARHRPTYRLVEIKTIIDTTEKSSMRTSATPRKQHIAQINEYLAALKVLSRTKGFKRLRKPSGVMLMVVTPFETRLFQFKVNSKWECSSARKQYKTISLGSIKERK